MFNIDYKSENYYEEELVSQKFNLSNFDFSKVVTPKDMLAYIDWDYKGANDSRESEVIYLDSKDVLGYDDPTIDCFQLQIDAYWENYIWLTFEFRLIKCFTDEDGDEDIEIIYGHDIKLEYNDEIFEKHWSRPLTKEARKDLAKLIYEDLANTFKAKRN